MFRDCKTLDDISEVLSSVSVRKTFPIEFTTIEGIKGQFITRMNEEPDRDFCSVLGFVPHGDSFKLQRFVFDNMKNYIRNTDTGAYERRGEEDFCEKYYSPYIDKTYVREYTVTSKDRKSVV